MKKIKYKFITSVLFATAVFSGAAFSQAARWSEQKANDWYSQQPWLVGSMSGDTASREPILSIVINTNSGIAECEVFLHEWYHLFHSPMGIQRSEKFEHRFSMEGDR